MYKTDVLIIGAGAVGTALAREFSKFKIQVLVCDKNDDVGGDASKSCSGLTSTSATMPVGTLECKIRTISHSMIDILCRDLDIQADVLVVRVTAIAHVFFKLNDCLSHGDILLCRPLVRTRGVL